MVKIAVNGESRELRDGITLEEVVRQELGLRDSRGVAVALNRSVVPKEAWSQTTLREGDAVEILVAAQGG